MASKLKTVYICEECGYESAKWMGQCPNCRKWNTLTEEVIAPVKTGISAVGGKSIAKAQPIGDISFENEHRYKTGITELDRVLGGGIVKGSVALISGDPGIGKSTILLQVCKNIDKDIRVLYVSGEESAVQLKLRANRLGVARDNLLIMAETDTQGICEYIRSEKPDLVMIDSIQTMRIAELSSSSGSIVQYFIIRTAKLMVCEPRIMK